MKKCRIFIILLVLLCLLIISFSTAYAATYTVPISTFPNQGGYLGFGGTNSNFPGKVHVGTDFASSVSTPVYAVLDGTVVVSQDSRGYGDPYDYNVTGGVTIIRHRDNQDRYFYAVYGHIYREKNVGDTVNRGDRIGTIRPYGSMPHLHFGINTVEASIAGYATSTTNWVNPVTYLDTYCKDSGQNQPPTLITPQNNATCSVNTSIAFSWSGNGASRFHLQITNPSGSNNDIRALTQTSYSYSPNVAGTWHWRVIAENSSGADTGLWSEYRSFTVTDNSQPPTPSETYNVNYYNNTTCSGSVASSESGLTSINKNWGSTGAPGGCTANLFSAVFTGNINFNTGWYNFSYTVDDSVKIILTKGSFYDCICDNNGLKNSPQSGGRHYEIKESGTYTVRIEYIKCHNGTGVLQTSWMSEQPPMMNVYFNSNGGSSVPTQTVLCNSTVARPPDPVKTGYTFSGWCSDSGLNNQWNFPSNTVGGYTTLYAKWTVNTNVVNFNSQGGSFINSISVNYNSIISVPTNPVLNGYIFSGWYEEEQCWNQWDFNNDKVVCNITLFAKWVPDAMPDLIPTDITYDNSNIAIGQQINFDSGIQNNGNSDSAGFNIKWFVNDVQMGYGYHDGIPAGANVMNGNSSFSWTPTAAGSYTVSFTVDCDNSIDELNEDNNSTWVTVDVPQQNKILNVNNVYDLINAINSDTTIILEPGEYNLDEVTSSTNPNVTYENGAKISNVENLRIYAEDGADVLLYCTDPYSHVLYMDNCSGFDFEDIILGHKPVSNEICTAGVIFLNNCSDVSFNRCDIYGCGSIGFDITSSSGITIDNSYIHNCSYEAVMIWGSEDITISNSTIRSIGNHGYGPDLFSFSDADDIILSSCMISNNGCPDGEDYSDGYSYMFHYDGVVDMMLTDCTISNNVYDKIGHNCHQIDFDSQGGSNVASKITDNETKITEPEIPVNANYDFGGWYKESACINAWNFTTDKVTSNVTLFAKWMINNYNVSASANNTSYGTVTGAGTYNHGASVTLTAAPNAGYRFVRWTENGSPVSSNTSYTFTTTGNRSLTAEFTALTPLVISCSKTDASVYGGANGSVTISASGGDSGSCEYSINGGASWQSSNVFGALTAATYTAAVRDAGYTSNMATCSVEVGQPAYIGSVPAGKMSSKANAGTALTLTPPASPKGYTVVSIKYTSTNPAVAAVDAGGNVTFLAGGKATMIITITAQMTDSKGNVKTKITTVKKAVTVNQSVKSISLNISDTTIARMQKVKLAASLTPLTASNKKMTWKSRNPKVAVVSSSGVVTGKAGGTAIITCTAKDGSGASASCTVTVTPIYPSGLKLSKTMLTIKTGKTASLKATVAPKNTDFKTVTWTSSNPGVATVDAKGKIKAIAAGTVTIKATTSNGINVSCTVIVQ